MHWPFTLVTFKSYCYVPDIVSCCHIRLVLAGKGGWADKNGKMPYSFSFLSRTDKATHPPTQPYCRKQSVP